MCGSAGNWKVHSFQQRGCLQRGVEKLPQPARSQAIHNTVFLLSSPESLTLR